MRRTKLISTSNHISDITVFMISRCSREDPLIDGGRWKSRTRATRLFIPICYPIFVTRDTIFYFVKIILLKLLLFKLTKLQVVKL